MTLCTFNFPVSVLRYLNVTTTVCCTKTQKPKLLWSLGTFKDGGH